MYIYSRNAWVMDYTKLKSDFKDILELTLTLNTEKTCLEYLEYWRWKGNIVCPNCKHDKAYKFSDGVRYKCAKCRKQFTAKVGTIFQSSKISLPKWFVAMFLLNGAKKGISSYQLARDLGVTQDTAWFMMHRIRAAYKQKLVDEEFSDGEVMALDESLVGGKNKNRHKDKKVKNSQGRSFKDKTPVFGMVTCTSGKVAAFVVGDTQSSSLLPIIYKYIKKGTEIVTDEWAAYSRLGYDYKHKIVDHGRKQYCTDDGYTTNRIEGFWTGLKRSIIGIYHKAPKKHLQSYVDNIVFHYNNRKETTYGRFMKTLEGLENRLSYKMLISR